jgi:arylsulfatase A-like enzyme
VKRFALLLALCALPALAQQNFVIIFADDLGYGDIGPFGHPSVNTPNLERMAAEGQRWTQFYVAASVCTPSRAGILTGRLPVRSGMASDARRVLFPDSSGGLPHSEVTIAEVLKQKSYATAAVGKWHLGHLPEWLPMRQGFDSYFGIPYSNDMDAVQMDISRRERFWNAKSEYFNVPLLQDETVAERPADQDTLTKRYTEKAVEFIKANRSKPFFVYLAHSMVHVPLFASKDFRGKSRRGLFGDAVEEIDWSVGRILDTLRELGLDKNTLVVFTSDNGPWLTFDDHGGSAGPLRMGKGSTWDGGMREPTVFWQPGLVKPGVVRDLGATLDLLPTFAALAGVPAPTDRELDGYDLSAALKGTGQSPRDRIFYYRGTSIWAARQGPWKVHYRSKSGYLQDPIIDHDPPLLYNLEVDPGEKHNVAADHPDIIESIDAMVAEHGATVKPAKDMLADRIAR